MLGNAGQCGLIEFKPTFAILRCFALRSSGNWALFRENYFSGFIQCSLPVVFWDFLLFYFFWGGGESGWGGLLEEWDLIFWTCKYSYSGFGGLGVACWPLVPKFADWGKARSRYLWCGSNDSRRDSVRGEDRNPSVCTLPGLYGIVWQDLPHLPVQAAKGIWL